MSELQELLTKMKKDLEGREQRTTALPEPVEIIPDKAPTEDAVREETRKLIEMVPIQPVTPLGGEIWSPELDNRQYMEKAKGLVTGFFEDEQWRYQETISRSDVTVWELGMSKDRFTIRMRVAVEKNPRVCRIDAIMPVSVDPAYDAILCRELVKLNQPLRYGAFQYDESDGELSYRYSFQIQHGFFTEELKSAFLAVMLTAQEHFLKLQKYAVGKFTKAETEQIRQYIERLIEDLELNI